MLFIAIFLILLTLRRRRGFSSEQHFANALDLMQTHSHGRTDEEIRRLLLHHLERAQVEEPVASLLHQRVSSTPLLSPAAQGPYHWLRDTLAQSYARMVQIPFAPWIIAAVFVTQAAIQR